MEGRGKGKGVEERGGLDFGLSKRKVKLKKGGLFLLAGKKKGGLSTPSPTWRLELCSFSNEGNSKHPVREFLCRSSGVSARKLCANLWELQPQLHLPFPEISAKGIGSSKGKDEDNLELIRAHLAALPSSSRPDQQLGAYMGNDVQMLLTQNHLAPPSLGGLMEGKKGQSSYRGKTSTELVKALKKTWALEEQQASNIAVLKNMKKGLGHSELQIKELQDDNKKRRQEMVKSRKQEEEKDKTVAWKREREQMLSAIWSDQKELDDERKLRKQSEDLQRRLAQENSDLKASYSLASKETERERKARILVENLCDEFAQEIRDYEHEVRTLRKAEVDRFGSEKPDRLVLHVAEAWLDGRMQMKSAEAQNRLTDKNTISSKLRFDIETFLQARHSAMARRARGLSTDRTSNICARRESFPLHEVTSAPQHVGDEDSSSDGVLNCFELNKSAGKGHYTVSSQQQDGWLVSLSSDQVQLKAPMTPDRNQFPLRKMDEGSNNQFVLHDQHRKYSMSSEGDKIHPVCEITEDSYVPPPVYGVCVSPTKQWEPKLAPPEFDKPRYSRKSFGDVKENTLKAKLLEARLEDQRARAKANKASS